MQHVPFIFNVMAPLTLFRCVHLDMSLVMCQQPSLVFSMLIMNAATIVPELRTMLGGCSLFHMDGF